MKVLSIIGFSESGKTVLAERLIRRLVASGRSVASLKHTHHPLTTEIRGDTHRFQLAGARPVILAGNGEAVIWGAATEPRILSFREPQELLANAEADWMIIEGYKPGPAGIAIVVERAGRERLAHLPANVVAVVSDEPAIGGLPWFRMDQIEELVAFLDRITIT